MTDSTTRQIAPYGSWSSPISARMLAEAGVRLAEPGVDGDALYWLESRAQEKGRMTLMRLSADAPAPVELTPAPFNVRSRVHEYGGGAWTASSGIVVFADAGDLRLYRLDPGSDEPIAITPKGGLRYANPIIDLPNRRVIAVCEDHSFPEAEAANTLVQLTLEGPNEDGGTILVSGTDFVAYPALNADGTRLAWMTWDHPNMPWDSSQLWTADLTPNGTLSDVRLVNEGVNDSVGQPRWLPDGSLGYIAETTGWWNLYRARDNEAPQALAPREAEFSVTQWVLNQSNWDIVDETTLAVSWTQDGEWSLGLLDLPSGELTRLDLPFTVIAQVRMQREPEKLVFLGASATLPSRLVRLDLDTIRSGTAPADALETVRASAEIDIDPGYFSVPEAISWTAPDGRHSPVHGFYYPPTNRDFVAPEGELPPVIVESHGGPTGATSSAFSLSTQYWTSRGFAILDVNYGGSTGYGRAYRERLRGQWGIVDIDDCVSGVQHLVAEGKADPDRLIIRGGSAGGYTTLAALTFRDVFTAGTSYFGIGDLEALATDTHKLESRYLDSLIGPYPERKDLYDARSPIHHTDRLSSPMILFQGLDDLVVPPAQATAMADAVRKKGLPVALFLYEGEGHGFRQAETIIQTAEAELSFYAQLFRFPLADDIAPITIDNLHLAGERNDYL